MRARKLDGETQKWPYTFIFLPDESIETGDENLNHEIRWLIKEGKKVVSSDGIIYYTPCEYAIGDKKIMIPKDHPRVWIQFDIPFKRECEHSLTKLTFNDRIEYRNAADRLHSPKFTDGSNIPSVEYHVPRVRTKPGTNENEIVYIPDYPKLYHYNGDLHSPSENEPAVIMNSSYFGVEKIHYNKGVKVNGK
jgi:hypothetical protein